MRDDVLKVNKIGLSKQGQWLGKNVQKTRYFSFHKISFGVVLQISNFTNQAHNAYDFQCLT